MLLYLILVTSNNECHYECSFLNIFLLPVSEVENRREIDADLPTTIFTCGVRHTHLSFE